MTISVTLAYTSSNQSSFTFLIRMACLYISAKTAVHVSHHVAFPLPYLDVLFFIRNLCTVYLRITLSYFTVVFQLCEIYDATKFIIKVKQNNVSATAYRL